MAENKKRMPLLNMDEVILLVDTYFQIKSGITPSFEKMLIQELSDSMRALPFFTDLKDNPVFRSLNGMKMCLSSVAHVDPMDKKKKNFGRGSILQNRVLKYYYEKRELLNSIANTIKMVSSFKFPLLPAYEDSIMGQLLPSYHEYLERNSKIVKNAKKVLITQGKTNCAICGCDMEALYYTKAIELLEAHIALPITHLNNNEKITLSDILLLCPTCHKLAHSSPELFEEKKLREFIKGR